ncbi:MAG: cryptochrome/photolyase family protein [Phenylobacterium sp.]|uniref:cryptochrome/photolyase family protein n=1 Tax=Phenylobacterium sp. TaxID=1871053 RepID=UPI001A585367|nr:cryptochrome/photolyase family protein [Phenylobacterium sp.]MBL8773166.1 cryptochrome/photolyase family protein [Phenylobacterium sp.]
MTAALRLVLGDQLTDGLSTLRDAGPGDTILMAEVMAEASYVRHHKQKLVMVFAAMRRFAGRLRARGLHVRYVALDDPASTGAIDGEILRALEAGRYDRVIVTEPGEWRLAQAFEALALASPVPVEVSADDRFICSRKRFEAWAAGRKDLRMEFFYREMRRATGLLMDGTQPVGGRWNFDAENRKKLPRGVRPPDRVRIAPAADVREAMALVAERFGDHFGDLDTFGWAVDADEARRLADHFIVEILPGFGDWQDAMAGGAPFLWHARLSAAINIGLLDPLEVCRRAEAAFRAGAAPLNAVEGFIRQILGWREFVRGVYWLSGPDYVRTNALSADRELPWFYWSGETGMACVRDVVEMTRRHAYAHHIQRLMVTGNLALLLGVHPDAVNDWYMTVFIDAFEWVEAPNTHGMAIFADGGVVGSKPYAASGAYINRMSDYCRGCAYDVSARRGEGACPFNRLYWDFLLRNRDVLGSNPRLAMPYRTLDGMAGEHAAIRADAEAARLELGARPRR